MPLLPAVVHGGFGWDPNTQVTTPQRSILGPAVVYDTSKGEFFIAWFGINCCGHNLNFISYDSTTATWGSPQTSSLTSGSAASCGVGLDMVYDPDNQNMYVVYVYASGNCGTEYLDVFHTSDGITLSTPITLQTSSSFFHPTITYNTVSKTFVVAQSSQYFTSSDGNTWSGPTTISIGGNPVQAALSDIKFINGFYFLSYTDSSTNIHIVRSSDLNTWSAWSNPPQQASDVPRINFDSAEGLYHLTWKGTDLYNQLNDATSPDAATWGTVDQGLGSAQFTQDAPSLAYYNQGSTLLIAWVGTDCFGCGSINVMQYYNIGGGGGGGSPWIAVLKDGQYTYINDILRGGMSFSGQNWHDTVDYYLLPYAGTLINNQYTFQVTELNSATNYLDSLNAYAINHAAGTNAFVTMTGTVLTYGTPTPALSVADNSSGTMVDVTGNLANSLVVSSDNSGVAAATGTSLIADLGTITASSAKLIVQGRVDPDRSMPACPCRNGIFVSVQSHHGWTVAGEVFLRKGGSTEGLDLSPYLKAVGNTHLKVKLLYLSGEDVNYIGVDTTPNASVTITKMQLTTATFGSQNVIPQLLYQDGTYLIYGAHQTFFTAFTAPPSAPSGYIQNIMIVTTGHYIA